MRRVIADVETNGLLAELDIVHCLVIYDLDTDEVWDFADQPGHRPIKEGLQILSGIERIYGHNFQRFDVPAIQKVYPGWEHKGEVIDTLLVCQTRFAHIKDSDFQRHARGNFSGHLIGKHTLEAWGRRLGVYKGDYDGGWEKWTPAMHEYCIADVVVNAALVRYLAKAGIPAQAIALEHRLAIRLEQQQTNGWPFDIGKAAKLQAKLAARREEIAQQLRKHFGSWLTCAGQTVPKRKRTVRRRGGEDLLAPETYIVGGTYSRIKETVFNPASRDHISNRLQALYGWKPTDWTKTGKPKVDETVLVKLSYEPAKLLTEYLLLDKRLGQLSEGRQAWLGATVINPQTKMPHIHHVCAPGPRTHRLRHFRPNLGQVPKVGSLYGKECRELFHVPSGFVQLGADVSGLELRCLGHYLSAWDEGAYAEEVIAGDIHQVVADALGISRDDAKTFSYATIYGAGAEKCGSIVGEGKKKGMEMKRNYMAALPAYNSLNKSVKRVFNRGGYVRLIDRRRCYPKSDYAAVNALLQGTGAVICKLAYVTFCDLMEESFGPQGWDGQWAMLGFIHDEWQTAVKPEIADRASALSIKAIEMAGEELGLRVPVTGEAKLGANWSECH